MSIVKLPLDLITGLTEMVRALADLPEKLERIIRETNGLIAESRGQLESLHAQASEISRQLEKMTATADQLLAATAPMVAMAEEARQQMKVSTEQLASTNRNLEQIVQIVEPIDRAGKLVAKRFRRVTGRGGADPGDDGVGD